MPLGYKNPSFWVYKSADSLKVLTTKNEVYIDIGSGKVKGAFELLYFRLSSSGISCILLFLLVEIISSPISSYASWRLLLIPDVI
ncbi:hypothetical protein B9G39_14770 [Zooshikella ganghwensis]|uniref:Uncharacterized protein n=1 Tax=Zooshikella ganghwensis TaxID=202772 RepID=A0A4P9VMH0_9GAMM|nr:hypothetical protein B9G39_14770 [Zooshikella ganghwensis]